MPPLLVALALAGPAQPQLPLPAPQPVAVTLDDFSRTFTPLPGKHEVWFVHPCTGRPVQVCFTLPPGKLKRFQVDDRDVEFHFPRCEVRIEFRKNGTVKVEYDD